MRWILLLILLWILYRLFKRGRPSPRKRESKRNSPSSKSSGNPSPGTQLEEMKRCLACGTYNPKSHSLEDRGNYYCNPACRQNARK